MQWWKGRKWEGCSGEVGWGACLAVHGSRPRAGPSRLRSQVGACACGGSCSPGLGGRGAPLLAPAPQGPGPPGSAVCVSSASRECPRAGTGQVCRLRLPVLMTFTHRIWYRSQYMGLSGWDFIHLFNRCHLIYTRPYLQ